MQIVVQFQIYTCICEICQQLLWCLIVVYIYMEHILLIIIIKLSLCYSAYLMYQWTFVWCIPGPFCIVVYDQIYYNLVLRNHEINISLPIGFSMNCGRVGRV